VIGGLWWTGAGAGLIVVAGTAALAARRATRRRAPAALLGGSLLGIGLLIATGLLMLFGWEVFFDGFHALLFPTGTWTFYYSDTLIRLYPERFWMDVGATLVGVLVVEAVVVGVGSGVWLKREEVGSRK
jgi:integral membrane protein (TIGR01906 family)